MNTLFTWHDIVIRLALTIVAAGAIGFDRDQRGRPAGLRTNLLVALAASIAMMQANALMISEGKAADSFVVMDTMRLPLGILSGIGFIGAGAIIKRGEMITGVTTAATLWFVTVMGLCFGGGQIVLGLWAFATGFTILVGLKRLETLMPQRHHATLKVTLFESEFDSMDVERLLENAGVSAQFPSIELNEEREGVKTLGWKIQWSGKHNDESAPPVIGQLARHPQVRRLEFTTR
ncbi:MAG: MgtC/SapB family protein [Candidatus Acidiferrales bacterium]